MKKLVDKLLSSGEVTLLRKKSMELPPEEKEILYKKIGAQILKGEIHKVIVINLYHEAEKINNPEDVEVYESEEIYRIPYTKDKKWLEKALTLATKKSHSYNANRV